MLTRQRLFQSIAWAKVRRPFACERGSVAIETALIFPVLITMFFGMIEFGQAFTVQRRVQSVASTVADLVSQNQSVSTSDLNDIASVGVQLMRPYSSTTLGLQISSIAADSNNKVTVQWSCVWANLSASAVCTATGAAYNSLPAGLLSAGQSVIVGQTSFPYQPIFGAFLSGALTFTGTAYFRPRLSASVVKQ